MSWFNAIPPTVACRCCGHARNVHTILGDHTCGRCDCDGWVSGHIEWADQCPAGYTAQTTDVVYKCRQKNRHAGYHMEGGFRWTPDAAGHRDEVESVNEIANPDRSKAADEQVGGDHYKRFKIQPWDIWLEYGLDPWLAGVIKYVLRAGRKGPKLEDLKKARHYLDRAIEIEEGR